MACAMDAIEGYKVVMYDILGAFLQANWPKDSNCSFKV